MVWIVNGPEALYATGLGTSVWSYWKEVQLVGSGPLWEEVQSLGWPLQGYRDPGLFLFLLPSLGGEHFAALHASLPVCLT